MGRQLEWLFLVFAFIALTHGLFYGNHSQAVAVRQIKSWQHQYNRYILKTLKHRTSGCTLDKLQYRREWYLAQ